MVAKTMGKIKSECRRHDIMVMSTLKMPRLRRSGRASPIFCYHNATATRFLLPACHPLHPFQPAFNRVYLLFRVLSYLVFISQFRDFEEKKKKAAIDLP